MAPHRGVLISLNLMLSVCLVAPPAGFCAGESTLAPKSVFSNDGKSVADEEEILPIQSDEISASGSTLSQIFIINVGSCATLVRQHLPDPKLTAGNCLDLKCKDQTITFVKRQYGPKVVWAFKERDLLLVAELFGLKLRLPIPPLAESEAGIWAEGLTNIFDEDLPQAARQILNFLPDVAAEKKNRIAVKVGRASVTFFKRAFGGETIWACKYLDCKKLAVNLNLKMRADIPDLGREEIGVHGHRLTKLYIGTAHGLTDPLLSVLPNVRTCPRDQELLPVGDKQIRFLKRKIPGGFIWACKISDKRLLALFLKKVLREDAPDLAKREIAFTGKGLAPYFVGGAHPLAAKVEGFLPDPRVEPEPQIVKRLNGVEVTFFKRKNGPDVDWAFKKKDNNIKFVAVMLGVKVIPSLKKIHKGEVAVSAPDLRKYYIGDVEAMARMLRTRLGDVLDAENPEVILDGVHFIGRRKGPDYLWTFKKKDIPKVGRMMAEVFVRGAVKALSGVDIAITMDGLRGAGFVLPYDFAPHLNALLPPLDRQSTRPVVLCLGKHKVRFTKRWSGPALVWSVSQKDKEALLQYNFDWRGSIPDLAAGEIAVSINGMKRALMSFPDENARWMRTLLPDVAQFERNQIDLTLDGHKITFSKRRTAGVAVVWACVADDTTNFKNYLILRKIEEMQKDRKHNHNLRHLRRALRQLTVGDSHLNFAQVGFLIREYSQLAQQARTLLQIAQEKDRAGRYLFNAYLAMRLAGCPDPMIALRRAKRYMSMERPNGTRVFRASQAVRLAICKNPMRAFQFAKNTLENILAQDGAPLFGAVALVQLATSTTPAKNLKKALGILARPDNVLSTGQAVRVAIAKDADAVLGRVTKILALKEGGGSVFKTWQAIDLAQSSKFTYDYKMARKFLGMRDGEDKVFTPYQVAEYVSASKPKTANRKLMGVLELRTVTGDPFVKPARAMRWAKSDIILPVIEQLIQTKCRLPDFGKDVPADWQDLMAFRGMLRNLKRADVLKLVTLFVSKNAAQKLDKIIESQSADEKRQLKELMQVSAEEIQGMRKNDPGAYERNLLQAGSLSFSFNEEMRQGVQKLLMEWHYPMLRAGRKDSEGLSVDLLMTAASRSNPYVLWLKGEDRIGRFDHYLQALVRVLPRIQSYENCPKELRKIFAEVPSFVHAFRQDHRREPSEQEIGRYLESEGFDRADIFAYFNWMHRVSLDYPVLGGDATLLDYVESPGDQTLSGELDYEDGEDGEETSPESDADIAAQSSHSVEIAA